MEGLLRGVAGVGAAFLLVAVSALRSSVPLGVAQAAEIRISAAVDADLRTVRGTMVLSEDLRDRVLVDPLARLPDPPDDLQLLRTFPGEPSRGEVAWTPQGDGVVTFAATLPRRFGTIGATRHGLFASGGWYPQPEGLPLARWTVELALPEGTGGAVGDVPGDGVLRWDGYGERAPIAVVRRPRFTPLDGTDVMLVTRGRPRPVLPRELEDQIALLPLEPSGVAVESPLRRRLVGHSPGLAYVSDRAFRLTPGFRFAHRHAVARGVAAAWVQAPGPFEREIAAAALGEVQDRRLRGLRTDRLLRTFAWVPQINALLASQRIAFYSEVLDRVWPADPVKDDLAEIFDPYVPGTAVLAQLDDTWGPGVGECVGLDLAAGAPLDEALLGCGVPPGWLDRWRAAAPPQDYQLEVDPDRISLTREAPPEGLPETVVLRVDGEDHALAVDPGETVTLRRCPAPAALPAGVETAAWEVQCLDDPADLGGGSPGTPGPEPGAPTPADPPSDAPGRSARRVVVDPDQHVLQTSRSRDSWPPRYDWTISGFVDTVNLSQAQLFASGFLTLRRQYDTRNLGFGSLSNDRSDLVTVALGYLRKEGPLLDGWTRPHRLRIDASASLLNPRFSATDGLRVALDSTLSWSHDDRVSSDFPLRGHRVGLAIGGGGVPGTPDHWSSGTAFGTGVTSTHPRVALAGRLVGSVARSPLPHRLLVLGGEGSMRSIPSLPACSPTPVPSQDPSSPCFPVATERLVGALELRWAPIRGASVPLLLAWGSELQLSGGTEAVLARVDGAQAWAWGATAGVTALGDVLGADTSAVGLTAAWPVLWDGLALEPSPVPQVYLRFGQAF